MLPYHPFLFSSNRKPDLTLFLGYHLSHRVPDSSSGKRERFLKGDILTLPSSELEAGIYSYALRISRVGNV
jgi:hypothetical protein